MKYIVITCTCILDRGNLLVAYELVFFDSMNQVFDNILDFFNNQNIYVTSGRHANESIIKSTSTEMKWIHLIEVISI